MDCRLPGSCVHGIFQARILEWVAISFFRDWKIGSAEMRGWSILNGIEREHEGCVCVWKKYANSPTSCSLATQFPYIKAEFYIKKYLINADVPTSMAGWLNYVLRTEVWNVDVFIDVSVAQYEATLYNHQILTTFHTPSGGPRSCHRVQKIWEAQDTCKRSVTPASPPTPGIHKNPKRTWAPMEPGIYLGYTWDMRSWGDTQLTGGLH